jgi:hypothetical protein
MKRMLNCLLVISLCALAFGAVSAQDNVAVPDLKGMNVPQAAAALNKSGLLLGAENNEGWTETSGLPQNTVGGQSVAAGQTAPRGSTVDVTVLRSPNALLIYDDNNLTLVNQGTVDLPLSDIVFQAVDGGKARYAAASWGGALGVNKCGQVWSIRRGSAKKMAECKSISWKTTNKPAEHFWTGEDGATQFAVLQGGVQRAVCPVSKDGRCAFYLAGAGAASDATAYVYFAYTTDALAIINPTPDQWMVMKDFVLLNNNHVSKAPVAVSDPTLYGKNFQPIGDVGRLAPNQCLLFTSGGSTTTPPKPCDVIAQLAVDPNVAFWNAAFDMTSATDDQQRSCPAATPGRLTICVMPR